jgi:hypothetical protein
MYLRSAETINGVRLWPTPEATYTPGITGILALQPTRTATSVEETFLDRYHTVLIEGALSRLLLIASAPWYDPGLAAGYLAAFERGIEVAAGYANADDLPKQRTTRYGGL